MRFRHFLASTALFTIAAGTPTLSFASTPDAPQRTVNLTNITDQILGVARATWPSSHMVGIVCDYSRSKDSIEAMLDSFPQGSVIQVIDVRRWQDIGAATTILSRISPQYVLLLPNDPLVRDGSFAATGLISRMGVYGIPVLGTSPAAVSQGAWVAMGPATGNLLQENPTRKGIFKIPRTHVSQLVGTGSRVTLAVTAVP